MSWWRRRPVPPSVQRRTGPPGEDHWWDDEDQAWVQDPLIDDGALGSGWRRFPMLNNGERLDPYGPGEAADTIRAERVARRLTALDEGTAWRRGQTGALLVARYEMFAASGADHRARWQELAPTVLDATWRERWRERDLTPGWIEARWLDDDDRPTEALGPAATAVDWLRVEDHTGEGHGVTVYQHVTIWADRLVATLTMRHDLDVPLDPAVAVAARAVIEAVSRRSDPGPGSA